MKKVTIFLLSVFMLSSLSAFAYNSVIVYADGCSDYIFAPESVHRDSALEDFRYEATQKCLDEGYFDWETISKNWTPGLNVKYYCVRGRVLCLD